MSDAFLPGNGFDTYETQDKVLVSMDGTVISSMSDYNSVVDAHKIGDTIDVTIIRNGEQKTVTLTFGEYVPSQNG